MPQRPNDENVRQFLAQEEQVGHCRDGAIASFLSDQATADGGPETDGPPKKWERQPDSFWKKSWRLIVATTVALTVLGVICIRVILPLTRLIEDHTDPPQNQLPTDTRSLLTEDLENNPHFTRDERGHWIYHAEIDEVEAHSPEHRTEH